MNMIFFAAAFFAAVAAQDIAPLQGVSREKETSPRWSWEERHDKFMAQIAEGEKEYDIVFVGDSITELMLNKNRGNHKPFREAYGELKTLNLGIIGDRIENVVWRLENGELDGYKAKVFRVLIGTNNVPKRWTPERLAAGTGQIVAMIREKHPESKIEILSLLPRDDRKCPKDGMERIKAANALYAKLADGETVFFVDAFGLFLNEDGSPKNELFKDGLHPNADGYKVLFDKEKPEQLKLMKRLESSAAEVQVR